MVTHVSRSLALALVIAACGGGQQAQRPVAAATPPPPAAPREPADPQPTTDGDVTEAWVHGMQILVKRVPGAEMVATRLYVRGGVRNWGRDDAGVEALLMRTAASGGTTQLDKVAFAQRLADLGSTIAGDAGNDYSLIAASSLAPAWDETFAMLVDVLRRPALPPSEIELQRQRLLSQLRHEQEDPDEKLLWLAHTTMFKDHPYANRAVGTPETVAAIDAEALRQQLTKLQETSRLLLVVVGDVDAQQVLGGARKGFADLQRGNYHETALPAWKVDEAGVFVTEQELPTNYILSIFPAPLWGDPDFATARVALNLLHQRVWEEVRTKRNLSYAPQAYGTFDSAIPRGNLYVTAVDPRATIPVLLGEARSLKQEPPPEKELQGAKAMLLSAYFVRNEAGDGQAQMMGEAQILGGDWRQARTLKTRIEAVRPSDVQAFARKHIDKLQTFVLGDPRSIDQGVLLAPL